MCLLITRTTSYNKSKFRYKILEESRWAGVYASPYRNRKKLKRLIFFKI